MVRDGGRFSFQFFGFILLYFFYIKVLLNTYSVTGDVNEMEMFRDVRGEETSWRQPPANSYECAIWSFLENQGIVVFFSI